MASGGSLYHGEGDDVDISVFSIGCYARLFFVVEVATEKHYYSHDIVVILAYTRIWLHFKFWSYKNGSCRIVWFGV